MSVYFSQQKENGATIHVTTNQDNNSQLKIICVLNKYAHRSPAHTNNNRKKKSRQKKNLYEENKENAQDIKFQNVNGLANLYNIIWTLISFIKRK